jgi:protein SCO1/2
MTRACWTSPATVVGLCAAAAAAAVTSLAAADAAATAPQARPTFTTPHASRGAPAAVAAVDVDEHLGRALPRGLRFLADDGSRVTLGDLFTDGKPVLMVLAYFRCPMLCDLVLRGVASAMRDSGWTLGREYRAITVSIDPKDTPGAAALKRTSLLQALGDADPGARRAWPFLVAAPGGGADVAALADALGFRYAYDPKSDQYAHPACAFLLTPDGRIARYVYGFDPRPRDLRLALLEAGGGRVARGLGGVFDRVLLTCFRYDPTVRRYGIYVVGVMRGGSVVVLSLMACGLALMLRRDRARQRGKGDRS